MMPAYRQIFTLRASYAYKCCIDEECVVIEALAQNIYHDIIQLNPSVVELFGPNSLSLSGLAHFR